MSRQPISVSFRDVDAQNALRLFASEGGVNVVAGEGVRGRVTLELRDVPLDQAFLITLAQLDLGFRRSGDVLLVAPLESNRPSQ